MVVTNALGIAFTATLLSASDAGVTFVFPEDGATNRLAWSKLSAASQAAVRSETQFAPVPPVLVPTFQMAQTEMKRIHALSSDGRLSASDAAVRRQRVRQVFVRACRQRNLSEEETALLVRRIDR